MKTKLLYALAVLFIFTGCSTENDNPRPNQTTQKTYLLQRKTSDISFTDGTSMTIDWNYLYNQDNKLTTIDAISKRGAQVKSLRTNLTYDERGRVHQITNEEGTVWTHHYDNLNELVRLVKTEADGTSYSYVNSFNTLGKLVEQKTYRGEVSAENYIGMTSVSYGKADHVILKRTLASGETSEEATVIIDDKYRPLPALPNQISLSFHSSEVLTEGLFTENNIVSFEHVEMEPADATELSFRSTYTYNEADYPTSSLKTFSTGAVERTTYTYLVR